ncbi:MAG: DUF4199 domain-containing protein [Marinilabiliales bacterium]|nr:DUF4199 domain-containing protein [Marinilabiliales bacterium]
MEQERPSLNSFAMMHGLYLGLAMILNTLVFYIAGIPFSEVSGYLTYLLIIAGLGYAMWNYSRISAEEGFPYSRALGLGTLVALFASVILSFFSFILYKYIEPGLIEKMLAVMEEKMLAKGMKDEAVESMLNVQKQYMTPTILSIAQIFSFTIIGFIFSLILAIFFKKEAKDPFYGIDTEEEEE